MTKGSQYYEGQLCISLLVITSSGCLFPNILIIFFIRLTLIHGKCTLPSVRHLISIHSWKNRSEFSNKLLLGHTIEKKLWKVAQTI